MSDHRSVEALLKEWRTTADIWEEQLERGTTYAANGMVKPPESSKAAIRNWINWLRDCANQVERLREALSPPTPQWQPIETAPRECRAIVASYNNRDDVGWMIGEAFRDSIGVWWWAQTQPNDGDLPDVAIDPQPTHWMPIPSTPEGHKDGTR